MTKLLSEQPELVEEIRVDDDDETIQRMLTPALLAEIDVVYEVVEATNTVEVWFIFHTKQHWENKL